VSVGSQRSASANNRYMGSEYDDSKPTSFILYMDCNNLYGKATTFPLQTGNFQWLSASALKRIQLDIGAFFLEIKR
jgi:hypothetical protein